MNDMLVLFLIVVKKFEWL